EMPARTRESGGHTTCPRPGGSRLAGVSEFALWPREAQTRGLRPGRESGVGPRARLGASVIASARGASVQARVGHALARGAGQRGRSMSEELGTIDDKGAAASAAPELRDDDGAVRADYVERVAQAITAKDSAVLRELVGDLHEADAGDLIEALDPELRPRLVALVRHDFDFSALTPVDGAVRADILVNRQSQSAAGSC